MLHHSAVWRSMDLQTPWSAPGAHDADKRNASASDSELRARCERLAMACEAMWLLLSTRLGFTDAELVEMIEKIDLLDGQVDGVSKRVTRPCPGCGRAVSRRFRNCMYCSSATPPDPFA